MNRKNNETIALRARDKARSLGARIGAAVTGAFASVTSVVAMAGATSVGQEAASKISGAESQIELVQTAMLGVLILLVVFALIRKSFGK